MPVRDSFGWNFLDWLSRRCAWGQSEPFLVWHVHVKWCLCFALTPLTSPQCSHVSEMIFIWSLQTLYIVLKTIVLLIDTPWLDILVLHACASLVQMFQNYFVFPSRELLNNIIRSRAIMGLYNRSSLWLNTSALGYSGKWLRLLFSNIFIRI
jgi:hypothetical protein